MNTNHIPVLMEVDRCRSINRAAQNLYMSQPQVSHIIRAIETEIGYPIFVRTKTGVTTTLQGELYLESLGMIATELEKIRTIPQQFEERQDISVAAVYSRFLFQSFLRFRQEHPAPGVSDCYIEEINELVIERVVSNQARLGILSQIPDLPGNLRQMLERYALEAISLRRAVPFTVILGKEHPLAGEQELTPEQLQGQTWVYFARSNTGFLQHLFQLDSAPAELLVSDRASFLEALSSGNYLSVSSTASELVTEGDKFRYLPVKGFSYTAETLCIKPRLYRMTARERQLLAFLRASFREYYGEESAQ